MTSHYVDGELDFFTRAPTKPIRKEVPCPLLSVAPFGFSHCAQHIQLSTRQYNRLSKLEQQLLFDLPNTHNAWLGPENCGCRMCRYGAGNRSRRVATYYDTDVCVTCGAVVLRGWEDMVYLSSLGETIDEKDNARPTPWRYTHYVEAVFTYRSCCVCYTAMCKHGTCSFCEVPLKADGSHHCSPCPNILPDLGGKPITWQKLKLALTQFRALRKLIDEEDSHLVDE